MSTYQEKALSLPSQKKVVLSASNINSSGSYISIGDFDGDGRSDFILYCTHLAGNNNNNNGQVQHKAYLYSAQYGYSPKLIHEFNNIPQPSGHNLATVNHGYNKVLDFNGDGKSDILIQEVDRLKIFTFNPEVGTNDYKATLLHSYEIDSWQNAIYLGDFNGDGRTDVLIRDVQSLWHTLTSDGTSFTPEPFSFANTYYSQHGKDQNGTVFVKNSLLLADFNGDGKTDIFNGGFQNGVCGGTDYYIELKLSKGNSFVTHQTTINNNIWCGPWYSSDPFIENFFHVTDLNSDGQADICYKSNDPDKPLALLEILPFDNSRSLEKATDGMNNTYEVSYSYLTDEDVHTQAPLPNATVTNFSVNYPHTFFNAPIKVVKEMTFPDGIGGVNPTQYQYEGVSVHKQGRGFLGFNKVIGANVTSNAKSYKEFGNFGAPSYLKKNIKEETYRLGTMTLLNITEYDYSIQTSPAVFPSSANHYVLRNDQVTSNNILENVQTIIKNQQYDAWENVTEYVEEIWYNWVGLKHWKQTITNFVGVGGAVPNYKGSQTVVDHRTGETALSTQQSFQYDGVGNLTQKVDFVNLTYPITTRYGYNNMGALIEEVTSSAGGQADRINQFTYDPTSRFMQSKVFSTSPADPDLEFTTTFNLYHPVLGLVTDVTNETCIQTKFEYDDFGRKIKTQLKHGTSEAHDIDEVYAWDINGVRRSKHIWSHPGKPDKTEYYDLVGRVLETKVEGFNNNDIISTMGYDTRGNVISSTAPHLTTETPLITTRLYDSYNRLIEVNNSQRTTQYSYTYSNGDLSTLSTILNTGQAKTTIIDPTEKIITSIDDGGGLYYSYDSWGNQTKVKHGSNTLVENEYDDYGKLISMSEANSGATTYSYDEFGQLIEQKDANSLTTSYTYDAGGKITTKVIPEGTIQYSYVRSGNCQQGELESVTNYNGVNENYSYDGFGRLITKDIIVDNTTFSTEYQYNQYDNQTSVTYPSGLAVINVYDNNSYLLHTDCNDVSQPSNPNTVLYTAGTKNGLGQITSFTLGNSVTTQKSYSYGIPVSVTAGSIQNLEYTFDPNTHNLNSRKDIIKDRLEEFTYDNMDRLTSSKVSYQTGSGPITVGYHSYAFDGSTGFTRGNIIEKTDVGQLAYASNRFHAVERVRGPNFPTPSNDPPLNMNHEHEQNISYSSYKRPVRIDENFGVVANPDNYKLNLTYTAGSDRVKSILDETLAGQSLTNLETKYFIGNYEKLIKPNQPDLDIHYINPGDGLCALVVVDGNGQQNIYYTYNDYLGSILTVTDNIGNVVSEQNFDAWGRKRNAQDWTYNNISSNPDWLYRGYTGHEHLPKFKLINMNARLYDPVLGRMLAPDPYVVDGTSTQAYNRYAYANNNPMSYIDPTGEVAWFVPLIIGVTAGSLSGAMINESQGKDMLEGAMIGGAIGGATALIGAALSPAGAMTSGAITGALGSTGFTAMTTTNIDVLLNSFTYGGISGAVGGFAGAALGGGMGAFASGASSAALNSAFNRRSGDQIASASLLGGISAYGLYHLSTFVSWASSGHKMQGVKFGYTQFAKMQGDYQRARFWRKEFGGVLKLEGGVYRWPRSARRSHDIDVAGIIVPGAGFETHYHAHHEWGGIPLKKLDDGNYSKYSRENRIRIINGELTPDARTKFYHTNGDMTQPGNSFVINRTGGSFYKPGMGSYRAFNPPVLRFFYNTFFYLK